MAGWQDVVESEPEFAARVQALFDAHLHKTLATLRRDGSPRISGIEAQFAAGQVWIGMMNGSQKLADVRRDPRIALHSAFDDPPDDTEHANDWPGDSKRSGLLLPMDDETMKAIEASEPDGVYFNIDIQEVVLTYVGTPADHVVIQLWRAGQPLKTTRRE